MDDARALAACVDRLALLNRSAGDGVGASSRAFQQASATGASVEQALRGAGVASAVVEAIRLAAPPDLAVALGGIADALGDAEERRGAFRRLALYPMLLAAVASTLAAVTGWSVTPAIAWVNLPADTSAPPPALLSQAVIIALVVGVVALVLLGVSFARGAPSFPARAGREASELALLLRATTALCRAGSELQVAWTAAARLLQAPRLRAAAERLAVGLQQGEPPTEATALLLGDVGGGLFAAAIRAGAATPTLAALADARESDVRANLPAHLLRAETVTLLVGGLAIGAAAISFMLAYAGTFGGL